VLGIWISFLAGSATISSISSIYLRARKRKEQKTRLPRLEKALLHKKLKESLRLIAAIFP